VKFCPEHWSALRHAVSLRKLDALIAEDGDAAIGNLLSEADHGMTIDNFDPLMGAHNAIWSQSMALIKERYQQNPLMTMAEDSDHPEWACPICALNWCHAEHDRICTKEGCDYPKNFDWTDEMVNGAADHMLSEWKRLGLSAPTQEPHDGGN
jgi:hypothetical protein